MRNLYVAGSVAVKGPHIPCSNFHFHTLTFNAQPLILILEEGLWRGCLLFNSNTKVMKKWPRQAKSPFAWFRREHQHSLSCTLSLSRQVCASIDTRSGCGCAHTVVQELGFSELKLYSDPDDGSLDLALQGERAKREPSSLYWILQTPLYVLCKGLIRHK